MSSFFNASPQFFDEAGQPYANGKLYFGEPNVDPKDNPQGIFLDAALTVPAANPQVLNARGTPSQGQIYLTSISNVLYSLLLEDSAGNQIFNIPSTNGVAQPPSLDDLPAIVVEDSVTVESTTDAEVLIDAGVGLGSESAVKFLEAGAQRWAWIAKAVIDGGSMVLRNIAGGGGEPVEYLTAGGWITRYLGALRIQTTATGVSIPVPLENNKQVLAAAGTFLHDGTPVGETVGITSVSNTGTGIYTVILDFFPAAEVDLNCSGGAELGGLPMGYYAVGGANASGTVLVNTADIQSAGIAADATSFSVMVFDLGQ